MTGYRPGQALASVGVPRAVDVIIANGESLSALVNLMNGARQLVGIRMPTAWTAASITFAVGHGSSGCLPLHWNGAEYTITAAGGAAASLSISLDPTVFAGWAFVQIRSGTAGTPVNQGAARTLHVMTRAV